MRLLRYILLAAVLMAVPAMASAQVIVTRTTLTNAISQTQTAFLVASATDFAAGGLLWVDREVMAIRSVSGLVITVSRGQMGTDAQAHAASETVFVSVALTLPAWHANADPDYGAACVRGQGQAAILPWFNANTGTVWSCQGTTWNGTNTAPITFNSVQFGAG